MHEEGRAWAPGRGLPNPPHFSRIVNIRKLYMLLSFTQAGDCNKKKSSYFLVRETRGELMVLSIYDVIELRGGTADLTD
jgi:hypothetical protein